MSTEIDNLKLRVESLKRRTTPLCEGLQREYEATQQRAENAYRAAGYDGVPRWMQGEGLTDYRLRLMRNLQNKSATWRSVELPRQQDILR
jgi:hypothetical protein